MNTPCHAAPFAEGPAGARRIDLPLSPSRPILFAVHQPTVTPLGAAGTVTGSKHLLDTGTSRILLDCGLFQGLKPLRLRNWARPPVDVQRLDAVVLSHAHLDHTGYLPALVKHGYRGPIYCTAATADLLRILLPDSAYLQQEEAEHRNRHGSTKHKPALPLYTIDDAEAALGQVQIRPYHEAFAPAKDVSVTYRHAGHILGSATLTIDVASAPKATLAFTGDLGRWDRPILRNPELIERADLLLLESTYGDRTHAAEPEAALAKVVRETAERGGVLIIPAFAVGRTQEILWYLSRLEESGDIPKIPVFLDSPMAIDVTDLYRRHGEEQDTETRKLFAKGDHPLRPTVLTIARTPDQSKAINGRHGPMIIISASGMATGGRVLHHLQQRLPEKHTTVLLVGFQAVGTRGRTLQEGAKHLRIFGHDIPVRARVETLDGLSAHADRDEILRWLAGFARPPRLTALVHGEESAATSLAELITRRLGWKAQPAEDGVALPLAP